MKGHNYERAFAFRFLVSPQDKPLKKILAISGGMVVCMVILMSLYGACEMAFHTGLWSQVPVMWVKNIPYNFIMALPVPHRRPPGPETLPHPVPCGKLNAKEALNK